MIYHSKRALIFLGFFLGTGLMAQAQSEKDIASVYQTALFKTKPILSFPMDPTNSTCRISGSARTLVSTTSEGSLFFTPGPRPSEASDEKALTGFDTNNEGLLFDGRSPASLVIEGSEKGLNLTPRGTHSFTLVVWVKADPKVKDCMIVGRKGVAGLQFGLGVEEGVYFLSATHDDGRDRKTKGEVGPNGEWQLITILLRDHGRHQKYTGSFELFVNDVQKAKGQTLNSGRSTLMKSASPITLGESFVGALDELALWSRDLREEEIQNLYAAATVPKEPMVIILH